MDLKKISIIGKNAKKKKLPTISLGGITDSITISFTHFFIHQMYSVDAE